MVTETRPAKIMRPSAPTVPFNQPAQFMDIPERVIGVGAESGQTYFTIGDNPAGPESVSITPPGGMPKRARIGGAPKMQAGGMPPAVTAGGGVSFANGGEMEIGPGGRTRDQVTGTDYLSEAERAWYLGQSTNIGTEAQTFLTEYNQGQAQPPTGTITPPSFSGGAGIAPAPQAIVDPLEAQRQAQQAAIDARGPVSTATAAQIQANTNVLNTQAGQINANRDVVNAVSGTFGPQRQQIDAQGRVIDAQADTTTAQRAQIQRTQQANTARLAEEQGIQAASANYADQAAIAQAQNARAAEDYKYALAGLPTPTEVNTASGADEAGLPTGTRAKLQTQEQMKAKEAQQAERLRAIQLDQAQQIVNMAQTDVASANQAAARVGLTVASAQLLVDEARNKAAGEGVNVQEAQRQSGYFDQALNTAQLGVYNSATALQQAGMPPVGTPAGFVQYTDPFSGSTRYMSAAEAAIQKNQADQEIARMIQGDFAGMSPSSIASIFYNGLITGKPVIDEAKAVAAITTITGNRVAAVAIVEDAKSRAAAQQANDPNNLAAQMAFGKPYPQLTPEERVSDKFWDAYAAVIAAQYGD